MKRIFWSRFLLAASLCWGTGAGLAVAAPTEAGPEGAVVHGPASAITVNGDAIFNHVSRLAVSSRVAGTQNEYNAVQYIKGELEKYGYSVTLQPFTFFKFSAPSSIQLTIEGAQGMVSEHLAPQALQNTQGGEVSGEIVDAKKGALQDLKGLELEGKIALIEAGQIDNNEKIANAADQGAVAVILYDPSSDAPISDTQYSTLSLPTVSLSGKDAQALKQRLSANDSPRASLSVQGVTSMAATSYNVVATLRPNTTTTTNDVVSVGAHHDSVSAGPGANDDASGVGVVLEIARAVAGTQRDSEVRFLTFGAEEYGLYGSQAYARSLSSTDIGRFIGHFQLDMVGSKNSGNLFMYTVNGQKNVVTDLGATFASRLSGVIPYGRFGRSDHVPFFQRGIATALYTHSPAEPEYHSRYDTIDKISKDKLANVATIVGNSVAEILSPSTPSFKRYKDFFTPVNYPFDPTTPGV
ncbi:M28 family peptidase [Paenibacillus sp. MZ04-78.2]|uniref:M28 family peptidase n=1 Tax=Paenibacillus sp. MZ04-78.2 TaxID=2962034 RepID=UPI0020B64071|nr:M28 family peptidase [Paenibacillus sp. MZ04-78.2]MCP3773770.1 M28 family peptidase [Paenibacillus sp. MZ04-78.2]